MFSIFKRKGGGSAGGTGCQKEPDADEPFLLTEADRMHADMIEPILKESGIPYERRGTLGAAVTLNAGTLLETYKFYVPYSAYEKCRELLSGII